MRSFLKLRLQMRVFGFFFKDVHKSIVSLDCRIRKSLNSFRTIEEPDILR